MQSELPFQSAIEQMEEHEIIDRLRKGMFSEEARPTAEAILRARGLDTENPVEPPDQRLKSAVREAWKPRLLPALFGCAAGVLVGRHLGAALAGAVGAAIAAAILVWVGWLVGTKVAMRLRHLQPTQRFIWGLVAVLAWLIAMAAVGVVAQAMTGRIRP